MLKDIMNKANLNIIYYLYILRLRLAELLLKLVAFNKRSSL
jgi:hypothetical protein